MIYILYFCHLLEAKNVQNVEGMQRQYIRKILLFRILISYIYLGIRSQKAFQSIILSS